MAVEKRAVATTIMLIEFGAGVSSRNMNGYTAAHFAAQSGNERLTQILVNAGADISQRDNLGRTPVHFAANIEDRSGATLLHYTVFYYTVGYLGICSLREDHHFLDRSSEDRFGFSVVYFPDHVDFGSQYPPPPEDLKDVILLPRSYGADVSVRDRNGFTAYNLAIRGEYSYLAKLLSSTAPAGIS